MFNFLKKGRSVAASEDVPVAQPVVDHDKLADYVMTHLMTPLAADRTHVECAWAFPKDVAAQPDFDPSYAVDFWDLTNRQDWSACESVQRGLSSPHAKPGPLAPDEDGVYQFVTRVARAYAGRA